MGFLNPLMLFGGLAAAVPVILHLLRRRRVRTVAFSDLRFLREVEVRRSRADGLRRWLLLLLRVLAILLIAGAAARPRLGGVGADGGDRHSLLVILDASASMQSVDAKGRSRFDRALEIARDLTDGLPRGGEALWIVAGAAPTPLTGGWLPAASVVANLPEGLRAGDGALDLVAALASAADHLERASHQPVVTFISDGQTPAAAPDDLAAAIAALAASGVDHLELVATGEPLAAGAVLDVATPVRTVFAGETMRVTARVRPDRPDQIYRLELDGRVLAEAAAAGPAGVAADVVFAVRAPDPGWHAGRVTAERDRAPADDQRAFVIETRDRLDVLLAHGAGRDGWRYLAEALSPGWEATGSDDTAVRLTVADDAGWSEGDLDDVDVLVLADPGPLGRRRLDAVTAWLEGGGGVWLTSGDPARRVDLRSHLLPALLGRTVDLDFRERSEGGVEHLRVSAPGHPIFAGLPPEALATLEEAVWRRSWRLGADDLTALAALEGGDHLLAAARRGDGRALLLASGTGPDAGDLAENAMFPPLVRRGVTWLGGAGVSPVRPADGPVTVTAAGGDLSGELELRFDPADPDRSAPAAFPARLEWREGRPVVVGPERADAGVWRLVRDGRVLGAAVTAVPASESDPSVADGEGAAALLVDAGLEVGRALAAAGDEGLGGILGGRELTGWFFLAAVLLLLFETRYSRGESPKTHR